MLTGMSVDGKAFTYVNQMATSESDPSNKREEWFECACCPPNVARVLGHMGGYLWSPTTTSSDSATVNIHLFASATLEYKLEGSSKSILLRQKTNYPWDGTVEFGLENISGVKVDVNLRIPGWAGHTWEVSISAHFLYTYDLLTRSVGHSQSSFHLFEKRLFVPRRPIS